MVPAKPGTNQLMKQGLHRLEKYLNMKGFLEKSLKIEYALKSTGETLCLEKCLNFTLFCKTYSEISMKLLSLSLVQHNAAPNKGTAILC